MMNEAVLHADGDNQAVEIAARIARLRGLLHQVDEEFVALAALGVEQVLNDDGEPLLSQRALRALEASEARFHAVFNATLDGMIITDEKGDWLEANATACALHEVSPDQIVGYSPRPKIVDLPHAFTMWQEMLATGRTQGEQALHCRDGGMRWVESVGIANIMPGRHLWVLHDISGRRAAEQAQVERAALQRTMLDALPAKVALLDPAGVIMDVNGAWRTASLVYGNREPQVGVGKPYLAVCQDALLPGLPTADAVADGIHQVLADEVPVYWREYPGMDTGGSRWYRLVAAPVETQGRRGAVVMHLDESAQHQAEEDLHRAREEDREFARLLTQLIMVSNRLAKAPTTDALCQQAVAAGLADLGFDRMSIWLLDPPNQRLVGMYGTDESGRVRDERGQSQAWTDLAILPQLLAQPDRAILSEQSPLYDDRGNQVGVGQFGAVALWNGETALGVLNVDNLLSHHRVLPVRWHIMELYASMLGHLLALKRVEESLRQHEQMLRNVVDTMPVGVAILAEDRRVRQINREMQRIWDSPDPFAEPPVPARRADDGRPLRGEDWPLARALHSKTPVLHEEVEVVVRGMQHKFVQISAVPVLRDDGGLWGMVVVNLDTTERKRHEQELAALVALGSALRHQTTYDGVARTMARTMTDVVRAQGVAIVSCLTEQTAVVHAASGAFADWEGRRFQLDAAEREQEAVYETGLFMGRTAWTPAPVEDLAAPPPFWVEMPLMAEQRVIGALVVGLPQLPTPTQMHLLRSLAQTSAAALQRAGLYEQLLTQARQLNRVMESVNFGVLLLDAERHVVVANQRGTDELARLTDAAVGEELRELGGQPIERFLVPHGSESRMQEIRDGDFTYEVTTVPMVTSEPDAGWLLMIQDVTRARLMQSGIQQQDRLAAVGQLAAGIAHDFNNILAVILLYTQMLQRSGYLNEEDLRRVDVIRTQAQNAKSLVRQILDFSRKSVLERQPLDLAALLRENVALWQRTLPESIVVRMGAIPDTAVMVEADPAMIQQSWMNLAVNARDAMPQGGELVVELQVVDEAETRTVPGVEWGKQRWARVGIHDTGTGIAPEHLPHIFDPFFTTKEIGKGTGLGLAQVYGIVHQHRGLVTVDSALGKGTTIQMFFPLMAEATPDSADTDGQETTALGSETILVVEDNGPAREATGAILEMMGYRVLLAADGEEGLRLFAHHPESVQLVISDMVMPTMGGEELFTRIKATNPKTKFMIVTGYPLEDEGRQLLEQGIVAWLQKPFSIKQLTEAVRKVLDEPARLR